MHSNVIDDLLPRVTKPSRYLGTEINAVRKDPGAVRLHLALAFPDVYEIGTSHFGIQILYHILNRQTDIAAERVFAPGTDMAAELESAGRPLVSLETATPLARFDIIGFSLLYELNYTNVLLMLDLAGIPFYAADRSSAHPLVIAGGPCTVNPEPMAPFFDAMVVGDGESVILEMARAYMDWQDRGGGDRRGLFRQWAAIEGVYVPAFFEPDYDSAGRQRVMPLIAGYDHVTRAVAADLDQVPFPDAPIVPFGRPVHDRLRLEVARGCSRGCRFCQAGMIYRPVRERGPSHLMGLTERALAATGYSDLSLLSLSTGDYSCLTPLMQQLTDRYGDRQLAVSIPSFRAGTLTPEMMGLIRQVRKTGFTIAPEAGSERLRAVINKNISEAEIVETVSTAFDLGWQLIKLYFMIGLPTETEADLSAIVDLVRRLKKCRPFNSKRAQINVSVATFIPKAHTPFQWSQQIGADCAREKIEWLRRKLKTGGVQFKWQDPETSLLEGLWARGDRRLAALLTRAYQQGCRFDGWSDTFDFAAWQKAFDQCGIDPAARMKKGSHPDAPLPWDHIDTRVAKPFLKKEYERAVTETATPDCRQDDCQGCGVCDFEQVAPKIAAQQEPSRTAGFFCRPDAAGAANSNTGDHVEVFYTKLGRARYFGHLELVNIMIRAIGRAKIAMAFSGGYHPKPKIVFEDALPLGVESRSESFRMTLEHSVNCGRLIADVNAQLPEGLTVTDCRHVIEKAAGKGPETFVYRICLAEAAFDPSRLQAFWAAPAFEFTRLTKKGKPKTIDLKQLVREMQLLSPHCLWLRLAGGSGASVRPAEVLRQVFAVSETALCRAEIVKLPPSETIDADEGFQL
ncbi:MAG: TIGR03960 family B12-binding radical SAM protein [Thermodesulfobacteriota bacterium]